MNMGMFYSTCFKIQIHQLNKWVSEQSYIVKCVIGFML